MRDKFNIQPFSDDRSVIPQKLLNQVKKVSGKAYDKIHNYEVGNLVNGKPFDLEHTFYVNPIQDASGRYLTANTFNELNPKEAKDIYDEIDHASYLEDNFKDQPFYANGGILEGDFNLGNKKLSKAQIKALKNLGYNITID